MQITDPELRHAAPLAGASPAKSSGARSPLATLLDRAIVIMMVAILLTLSWPVSVVLWHQSRSAMPAVHQGTRDAP